MYFDKTRKQMSLSHSLMDQTRKIPVALLACPYAKKRGHACQSCRLILETQARALLNFF